MGNCPLSTFFVRNLSIPGGSAQQANFAHCKLSATFSALPGKASHKGNNGHLLASKILAL